MGPQLEHRNITKTHTDFFECLFFVTSVLQRPQNNKAAAKQRKILYKSYRNGETFFFLSWLVCVKRGFLSSNFFFRKERKKREGVFVTTVSDAQLPVV